MGPEFTLLRFDCALDVTALETAARDKAVPLKILDVKMPDVEPGGACPDGRLVLSRPDQHVAWRGDRLPEDPALLIDRVRGAADPKLARKDAAS